MSKRRKVTNLLALAVLSTVVQRPMHRYEMASIMRARGKEEDMAIKWGSLYTVVDNLTRHGFLEVVGSTRQGARPERTVYRITDAGRDELRDWTRELLATPTTERTHFTAGLSVLMALGPEEVIELLHMRHESLTRTLARQRAELDQIVDVPRLFLIENEYAQAMLAAEIDWVATIVAELESGSFPDLAGWEAWHRTGVIPAEYAELAERRADQP